MTHCLFYMLQVQVQLQVCSCELSVDSEVYERHCICMAYSVCYAVLILICTGSSSLNEAIRLEQTNFVLIYEDDPIISLLSAIRRI